MVDSGSRFCKAALHRSFAQSRHFKREQVLVTFHVVVTTPLAGRTQGRLSVG